MNNAVSIHGRTFVVMWTKWVFHCTLEALLFFLVLPTPFVYLHICLLGDVFVVGIVIIIQACVEQVVIVVGDVLAVDGAVVIQACVDQVIVVVGGGDVVIQVYIDQTLYNYL